MIDKSLALKIFRVSLLASRLCGDLSRKVFVFKSPGVPLKNPHVYC
jgi:hypothetical protein